MIRTVKYGHLDINYWVACLDTAGEPFLDAFLNSRNKFFWNHAALDLIFKNIIFSGNLNEKRYPLYKHLTLLRHLPDFPPPLEKQVARVFSKVIKSYFNTDLSHAFPDSFVEFTGGYLQGNVKTFSRMLHDSKIAICPSGFKSPETCRHFEAMRAGCVVISEPLPEHHFYQGSPMIMLDSWKDLEKTVESLLSNPAHLHEVHEKTLNWWKNVCSERATALYIRDTVKDAERSNMQYSKYLSKQ